MKSDYSYQEDAVFKIQVDLEKKTNAKLLLVIPTGGGKTRTALKLVERLQYVGIISKNEKVLWVTHLNNLQSQVNDVIDNFFPNLKNIVDVQLRVGANMKVNEGVNYGLIIIDEAHHSAASTYRNFFNRNIPVIGLTATPIRSDEKILGFDKISYQIKFAELLSRNVISKPEFINVDTNIDIDIDTVTDLENQSVINSRFNIEARNNLVVNTIFKSKEAFRKVVVFAGSNDHVDSLYELFRRKNKLDGEKYHIGYIYGEARQGKTNEKGIDNNSYLKWHKEFDSPSILISCNMLTEGYDDPSINTVVLTIPTKSIRQYLQCVGRVVRKPQFSDGKIIPQQTFVLEFSDKYVNAIYHINNEWLFSDLSPKLEPKIIREKILLGKNLSERLKAIMNDHCVDEKYYSHIISSTGSPENISLLLFKPTVSDNYKKWIPLIFDEQNRDIYTKIYNELSANIYGGNEINPSYIIFDKIGVSGKDAYFTSRDCAYINDLVSAMKIAYKDMENKNEVRHIKYYNFVVIPKRRGWLLEIIIILIRKFIRNLIKK